MPVRSRLHALIAALAILMLCGVTVAHVPAANAAVDPAPLTINGEEVRLSTGLGSAKNVRPGLYKATLATDETPRYMAVSRTPGETVTVSVTGAVREPGTGYFATAEHSLKIDLVVPPRTSGGSNISCGSHAGSSDSRLTDGDPLGNITAAEIAEGAPTKRVSTVDETCAKATVLYVEITRAAPPTAGAMPVEILINREPRTSGTPDQPSSEGDLTSVPVLAKDDAVKVTPGHGYSDAATLPPDGTTQLELAMGEMYYYKVRVGWGQRLSINVEVPRAASRIAPKVDTNITATIRNPQRLVVRSDSASKMKDIDPAPDHLEMSTAPVRWSNRNLDPTTTGSISTQSAQVTTVPGWYYIGIAADPYDKTDTTTNVPPFPAQLTVQVTGTETAGPAYVNAANQAIQEPAKGAMSIGGDKDSGSSSSFPWVKLGVSALAVLLAAAAVAWALRSRRTT